MNNHGVVCCLSFGNEWRDTIECECLGWKDGSMAHNVSAAARLSAQMCMQEYANGFSARNGTARVMAGWSLLHRLLELPRSEITPTPITTQWMKAIENQTEFHVFEMSSLRMNPRIKLLLLATCSSACLDNEATDKSEFIDRSTTV